MHALKVSLIALMFVALAAAPAGAGSVSSSTAPLLDKAGHDSGCTITLQWHHTKRPWILNLGFVIGCEGTTWQRIRNTISAAELLPDGTLGEPQLLYGVLVLGSEQAGASGGVKTTPCGTDVGEHTYVLRAWGKVKQSLGDPNPYRGTAESLVSVDCPS